MPLMSGSCSLGLIDQGRSDSMKPIRALANVMVVFCSGKAPKQSVLQKASDLCCLSSTLSCLLTASSQSVFRRKAHYILPRATGDQGRDR